MNRLLFALGVCLVAATAFAVDRMAAPAGAEVYFIAPQNGAKLHGPVTVRLGSKAWASHRLESSSTTPGIIICWSTPT